MIKTLVISTAFALMSNLAAADSFKPVSTQADFKKLIGNKTLTLGNAYVTIRKNGKLSGKAQGGDFKGRWIFQGGFFCRNLDNSNSFPTENCQTVAVSGKKARFVANRGKGTERIWDIK